MTGVRAFPDSTMGAPTGATTRLPVLAPIVDGFARAITYLRVSLTDRCNYRCTYCMPEEGVQLSPRSDVLTIEETAQIVEALARTGVRRVRLTGGEPTVRHGLIELVERLARLGLDDLAMTTNGHTLREMAGPLKAAGLRRLNISIDTLDAAKFKEITRWGDLGRVLDGIEAARAAGFLGTKLNVVALAGFNDREIPALCRYAWERGMTPRFIEWVPMSDGQLFAPGQFLAAAEIRRLVEEALGPIESDEGTGLIGVGPARYQRIAADPGKRFGVISAVTEQFCDTCNRVRLSATGQLHTCLARDEQIDLRGPLRASGSPGSLGSLGSIDRLVDLVRAGVAVKEKGHTFEQSGCGGPRKHMVTIGG